jgi:hypothetical protein
MMQLLVACTFLFGLVHGKFLFWAEVNQLETLTFENEQKTRNKNG